MAASHPVSHPWLEPLTTAPSATKMFRAQPMVFYSLRLAIHRGSRGIPEVRENARRYINVSLAVRQTPMCLANRNDRHVLYEEHAPWRGVLGIPNSDWPFSFLSMSP